MKRVLAIILSIILILSGCGTNTKPNKSTFVADDPTVLTESSISNESGTQEDNLIPFETEKETIVCSKETSAETYVPESEETSSEDTGIESDTAHESVESSQLEFHEQSLPEFSGLDDDALSRYLEDKVYSSLLDELEDSNYYVSNVSAVYISKEYLEELEYNSQQNIFFGYTLDELDNEFLGTRYMFTLGDDGKTIVTEFENFDDTYEKALKNVAIGAGVILLCVTISVVTGGAGAPAASMIFAVSAKTGAIAALSGGAIGGISAGIAEGIKTKDFDKALKAAALTGSESFKWGAISGALAGGAGEAIALNGATANGLTMNQAATIQKESKYPLDVIKQFHSMEEYNALRTANLEPYMVNGKTALIRNDIDLNQIDELGNSNLQRMMDGYAPLDKTGKPFELHHIGQKNDATLAILTNKEHNASTLHNFIQSSEIDRVVFDKTRKEFWKAMYTILQGA